MSKVLLLLCVFVLESRWLWLAGAAWRRLDVAKLARASSGWSWLGLAKAGWG
jgi:hypothetical protein